MCVAALPLARWTAEEAKRQLETSDPLFSAFPDLAARAVTLLTRSIAPSTSHTYISGLRKFQRFCHLHSAGMWPVSAAKIIGFATWCHAPEGLIYRTIRTYITAVLHFNTTLGYDSRASLTPQVHKLLRGIRRLSDRHRREPRLPVTVWLLPHLLRRLTTSPGDIHLGAAVVAGVFGLLRAGEFTAKIENPADEPPRILTRSHCALSPDCVTLTLESSKTDPFRKGAQVKLFRTGGFVCPWRWVQLALQHAPNKTPGGALFQDSAGAPLTYTALQTGLRALVKAAGLDTTRYSTHSLRIGGATSLALLGTPPYVIKHMGRWTSASYQLYTRIDDSTLANTFQNLATESARAGKRQSGYGRLHSALLDARIDSDTFDADTLSLDAKVSVAFSKLRAPDS